MKMGIPIMTAGTSWLYEQMLYLHHIPTNSNYIDADLIYKKEQTKMFRHETKGCLVFLDDNNIIMIDKRAIDKMPDMPNTFGLPGDWP